MARPLVGLEKLRSGTVKRAVGVHISGTRVAAIGRVFVRLVLALTGTAVLAAPASADDHQAGDEGAEAAKVDASKTASGTWQVDSAQGEVIVITGEAPSTSEPVTYELTPEVIRKMPGAGNDAIKSLQTMPGVGRVPFGMGGLILRGTSPRDSEVYLDGIEVPLLYHFGGLASFYPSSLLSSLELVPGGYSVEYGRGQGGVVTLESRAARSDRWRVGSELSLLDASVQADGPSGKYGSWSVAARRSYIDAVLPYVSIGDQSMTQAPRYMDAQLRYDVSPWHDAKLTMMLFGSDDQIGVRYGVDQDRFFGFETRFARLGLRFQQRRGRARVEIVPWIGVDRYHLESSFQTMTSANDPTGLRGKVTYESARGYLGLGVDVAAADFRVDSITVDDDSTIEISRADSYFDSALWLEGLVRFSGDRYTVKPGVRLDRYGLADAVVVDPRIVVNERLSKQLELRESIGVFHQPPTPADSLWGNEDLGPSHSVQSSVGGELRIGSRMSVSLTGFHSELYDVAVDDPDAPDNGALNRLETYKIGALASSREFISKQFGTFSELANIGRGRVYGVEVMGQYVGRRGFAWLAYTFSRAWRQTAELPRHPWVLDQPHVLTAVGSWTLGNSWRVGARLRVASGNPLTPVVGRTLDADGEFQPVFGEEMSERLTAFSQLDLRVDREWRRNWGTIAVFLDVQNATNAVNVEGRVYEDDYSGYEQTNGLPIFPSFGIVYAPSEK